MAGKYYTMQEVTEKLGKSEQEVKNLVKEGKLRQFLDRGNPLFDPQQVDAMTADEHGLLDLTAAGTDFDLQLEETSAIQLEPDDSTPAAEAQKKSKDTDSEGGFGLSMAGGKDDDISSSDTVASSMGINILDETDDAYKLTSDSLGETKAGAAAGELDELESLDADGNMESLGSGSGLLDLSLQADDTSLGAVLDDILPSGGGDMPGGDMGGGMMDEPAGMLDEVHETEEVSEISMPMAQSDPMIQEIPAGPSAQLVAVSPIDPATSAYGVAMFIPFVILILAAIAVGAGLLDISPSLLGPLGSQMFGIGTIWIVVIAAVLLMIILLAVMATTMGGGGSASASPRAKAAKPKKEKKVKVKKEKKAKK